MNIHIYRILTLFFIVTYFNCSAFSQSKNSLRVNTEGLFPVLEDSLGNKIIGHKDSFQTIITTLPYNQFVLIQKNYKWAFYDLKGFALTPFIFNEIHPANLASYEPSSWFKKEYRWFYKGLSVVEKDQQFAVLNDKLEYVVPFKTYDWISPLNIGGLMIVKQNNKYGLLNHDLKLIQPIIFDTLSNSPSKRAHYQQNFPTFWAGINNKYFIYDSLGQWIDSIEYDNIDILKDNFFLASKGQKSWLLDRYGAKINVDYTVIRDDEDYFIAQKENKFGLVYPTGEIVLPFEYDDIDCERGLDGNIFVKKNNKWGVVNEENEQLLPCIYDYINYAWDDSKIEKINNLLVRNYIVVQNDKFGKMSTAWAIDSLGNTISITSKEIFPCKYDGLLTGIEYGPQAYYVMQNDKMGLIDYNGTIQTPLLYKSIWQISFTNWVEIYDKGKMGLFDISSQSFLLPIVYDNIFVDNDWNGMRENRPTRIITYRKGKINILNEHGKKIQSNVSKTEIKKRFNVAIDEVFNPECSSILTLMKHNKTYKPTNCIENNLKEQNRTLNDLYYSMPNKP